MRTALAALRPAVVRHPLPPQDPSRPKGLNVLGTLAHNPELATAYHTLTGYILFGSNLSARQRELLVLRVAAVRGSRYEWLQHTILAARSEEHTSELQSLMRISYAVFCLKTNNQ